MAESTALPLYRRISVPAWVMLGMIFAGTLVISRTVWDYGVSWDEQVHSEYGQLVLEYFSTYGRVNQCNSYINLAFYGPAFDMLGAILYHPWPALKYEIRHASSALAALLTLPALYRIGKYFGSPWIGVLAGASLLLMPRFYGQAFINSKDIPFACLFAWTMATLLQTFVASPPRMSSVLSLGLILGLTLAVRPAGLALFAVVAILLLIWNALSHLADTPPWHIRRLTALLAAILIAWTVMVLLWPYAHLNPITRPIHAMREAFNFRVAYPVLFEGRTVLSNELSARYLPKYILITVPPAVLILAGIGVIASFVHQFRRPRTHAALAYFLLQAWLFAPILLFAIQRPNVYDGMRHFLFLLPALALWYALGIAALVSLIRPIRIRAFAIACAILLTLLPLRSILHLHPYEMTYFNRFVGGLAGANGQYETDYWATSYREAIEWVSEQAASQPDRVYYVLVAIPEHALDTVLPFAGGNIRVISNFRPTDLPRMPAQADYYIATYRYGQDRCFPESPIVHTVGRDGATFTVVRAGRPDSN